MPSNTAPIKYAQRSDSIYLTISLPDVKDEKITLTDGELKFHGKSEDKEYEVNIEFFKPVNAEGSTYKVLPRSVQMHILKKEDEDSKGDSGDEEAFWPRLLKDKALEKNQVKVDWDRYVDEDEEEEEGGFDMSNLQGGMGMGGMPGMEGMGGMPGMGGMGGMPGMGGMGGMPGGMPGMGGMPGGMDINALMENMKGMGAGDIGADGDDDDEDSDDGEDLPDLEEVS
eukprot:CAMPEP_0119573354 /NCGR_PEP_ID=MMETSP1352-20130426/45082_1 /TAXON_ID=265584 /ORGANISM="Stauroneis constricta, Strain CCMP1120" /LENGTH=225 /DNA_ID=CAMNT_0007623041 /DNA_START=717 /DNA_END=1394 /DNA_ORIENTATION=-